MIAWTTARGRLSALERHHGHDPDWADRIAEARQTLRDARMDDLHRPGRRGLETAAARKAGAARRAPATAR